MKEKGGIALALVVAFGLALNEDRESADLVVEVNGVLYVEGYSVVDMMWDMVAECAEYCEDASVDHVAADEKIDLHLCHSSEQC